MEHSGGSDGSQNAVIGKDRHCKLYSDDNPGCTMYRVGVRVSTVG